MDKNNINMPDVSKDIKEKLERAFNGKQFINRDIFENAIKASMFEEEDTDVPTNK